MSHLPRRLVLIGHAKVGNRFAQAPVGADLVRMVVKSGHRLAVEPVA